MNRERFFENIRSQLNRSKESPVASYEKGAPEFYLEQKLSRLENIQLYIKNVEEVGGVAFSVSNLEEAYEHINKIVDTHKPNSILRWRDPLLDQLKIENVVQYVWNENGSKEENVEIAKQCDIGMTSVDFAIANTGTVAIFADGRKGRSVSLLPPIYICIIRAEQLVTRMGEAFSSIRDNDTSSLNFITGPSKSADIESKLTIGVHGPKYFYAIIINHDETNYLYLK